MRLETHGSSPGRSGATASDVQSSSSTDPPPNSANLWITSGSALRIALQFSNSESHRSHSEGSRLFSSGAPFSMGRPPSATGGRAGSRLVLSPAPQCMVKLKLPSKALNGNDIIGALAHWFRRSLIRSLKAGFAMARCIIDRQRHPAGVCDRSIENRTRTGDIQDGPTKACSSKADHCRCQRI